MTRFRGAGTALVTPFTTEGRIDFDALSKLVDWQIEQGIDFLVACGSTGEAQTLSREEREAVVAAAVRVAKGRVPVVAGATSSDTASLVDEVKAMCELGVQAVMTACPYYNKPTQAGLERHFTMMADAASVPLIVYNVPGRTAINLDPRTTLRLARHPNILAVKEASGNLGQIARIIAERPEGFLVLSGDDPLALAVIAMGGDGLISVISNAAPNATAALVGAALRSDLAAARSLHYALLPLMDACFIESNPIPVKAALALMGRMSPMVRLPLLPAASSTEAALRDALSHLDQARKAA
ncbi:MAG: 4-hydroxy-tetrahydrodipicolinate synthase [Gemmatimonadales bacterium]